MNGNSHKKRRRRILMKEDPHCWYCGCEVTYYLVPAGETVPDNFATIDHLYTRHRGVRPAFTNFTRILACRRCNGDRGRWDDLILLSELPPLDLNQEPPAPEAGALPVELDGIG